MTTAGHGGKGGLGRPQGDSGAAGGRCPEAVGETPPLLRPAQRPEGPGLALPAEHLPLGTAWRYAAPPPPTKGRGSPPRGSLWGRSLFYSHVHDSPHPSRFPTAPQPAAPSPCCSAAPHGGKNKAQPCTNRPLLGSSQSVGGGGGTVRMAPGSRAELAAVGPWLRGAVGQNGDPAGPDPQDQPGHCYDASCPSPHGVLWLSAGIARSAEMLRGEREGRAGAPWQPPGSGGISLHVPQAPHIPYSGLTSSQLPPAAPQPGAQQCRGSLHPPWDTLLGTVTACSTCRRSGCP